MTTGRMLLGVLILAAVTLPPVLAAWRWQRLLTPRPLALHVLASALIALALVVVTAELLGAIGLFDPVPLILGIWLTSGAAYALAARQRTPVRTTSYELPTTNFPSWLLWLTAASVAAVAVRWTAGTFSVLANGVHDPDTLHHHLSFAAEFVRTGFVTNLHPVFPDPIHAIQPYTSELVQAIGMLALDSDVLAPTLNLAWLALFLLAGWSLGLRDGIAPLTLLAAAWLAGIYTFTYTNAGTTINDIPMLAALASAAALWRAGEYDRGWLALAGLAIGLAISLKVTALAPAGALTLAIIALAPRERRASVLGVLAGTIFVAGSFWYLRNLARTGSPLPAVDLPLFSEPDMPLMDRFGFSLSDYLFDGDLWREIFWPAFRLFFGWSIVFGAMAVVAGVVFLARGRDRFGAVIFGCGVVGTVAYLLTPAGAWGFENRPDYGLFYANVRYLLPGLALLVLGGALGLKHAPERLRLAAAAVFGIGIAFQVLRKGLDGDLPARFPLRALVVVGLLGAAVFLLRRWRASSALKAASAGVAVAVLAAVAVPPQARHLEERTTTGPDPGANAVYKWADGLVGARIGHYAFEPHYHLYGPDWDNAVDYIGVHGRHGAFRAVRDCREYVRVLDDERFDYVVLGPKNHLFQSLDHARWTERQPNAELVQPQQPYVVYRVQPPYDPRRCPRA